MDKQYISGETGHGFSAKSANTGHYAQLNTYDYLADIPDNSEVTDLVEVQFKNTRKAYFHNCDNLPLKKGDIVAVESNPGHDIGVVSLTGKLVPLQMKHANLKPNEEIRKIYRLARPNDMERYAEAKAREHDTMIQSRQIAKDLGLEMKIGDVEYQGDGNKAIFYYIADGRVDFRQLIKVLADTFHVRIEMKQIGVRQEAGKVGGIGTCGRELCCSTWLTNFKSVTTSVAKAQQILPNPQKLAGQCGKLKCCLNFEYAVYADALKKFPPANTPIRFKKGLALYKKTDVFRGIMWYAYEGESELYAITAENVKAIIEMNKNQEYPEKLEDYQVELMSTAALAQESSEDEFERELKLMADDSGSDTASQPAASNNERQPKGNREQRQPKGNREQRQPKGNREQRQQREQRPRKENHDPQGQREQRQQREPRERDRNRDNRHKRRNDE
jgi:cell fate regulator YaaT (PSP1 superfamily)